MFCFIQKEIGSENTIWNKKIISKKKDSVGGKINEIWKNVKIWNVFIIGKLLQ